MNPSAPLKTFIIYARSDEAYKQLVHSTPNKIIPQMESHAEGDLILKFLFAGAFICFVIGYAIYRWISNQRTSNYSARLVKTLDNAPELDTIT